MSPATPSSGEGGLHVPGGPRPIRVLIADDHEMVRAGLRMFLSSQPDVEVVGEVGCAAEAVERACALRPDVVLMDLVMPAGKPGPGAPCGPAGIEAIAAVRKLAPEVRCLALTSFSEEDKVLPALEAGASGYLLKDVGPEELVRAIRTVAEGRTYLSAGVVGTVVQRVTRPAPASPLDRLTPREREVLGCVARGMSNREIARQLFITEATAKSHVTRILRKLALRDRTQAAAMAVKWGLPGPR